jgi:hypothetical protein
MLGMLFAIYAGTGCIVVTDGGGYGGGYGYSYNSAPYIERPYVGCEWDSYYQDYAWDFVAQIYDADGDRDVADVFIEVWDGSGYLESWDLVYDGNGQWSNLVYETYSNYLNCDYMYDYEFDFYAYDYSGDYDSLTYIP